MSVVDEGVVVDIDHDGLMQELDDGEQNLEDEAEAMLKSWDRESLLKEVAADRERIKRENENKGTEFYDGETDFDTIATDMTPLPPNNQVYIKILKSNPSGKQIMCNHTIFYDQVGYLEYEIVPFDSSIHSGKPIKLNLMEGPILPGMLKALIELREGETAQIMIKPSMAYKELGVIGSIPESASLYYYVKIHKVYEQSQLDEIVEHERIGLNDIPFEEQVALIEEHKNIANTFLRDDMPREAIIRYKAAIKCLDELPSGCLERSVVRSKLMVTLLTNAAITLNKLGMHKSATKNAKRALFMDPTNIKAFYQLAKSRIGLADYSGASKWIDKASKISPNNRSLDELRLQLDFQYREEKKKRDEIMLRMSKACQ